MGEKYVPLEDIFRDRRNISAAPSGRPQSTSAEYLLNIMRMRSSLTLLELENVKDIIEGADLSFPEVVQLEAVVRSRAAACERTQGWHAGFGDLLRYLVELRMEKEAA